jgi:hypothetical protein
MRNIFTAPAHSRQHTAASRRVNLIGTIVSSINTLQLPSHRANRHFITSLITFNAFIVSCIPLLGFTTTAARACACASSPVTTKALDLPAQRPAAGYCPSASLTRPPLDHRRRVHGCFRWHCSWCNGSGGQAVMASVRQQCRVRLPRPDITARPAAGVRAAAREIGENSSGGLNG